MAIGELCVLRGFNAFWSGSEPEEPRGEGGHGAEEKWPSVFSAAPRLRVPPSGPLCGTFHLHCRWRMQCLDSPGAHRQMLMADGESAPVFGPKSLVYIIGS